MKVRWLRALPGMIAAGVCGLVFLGQQQPQVDALFDGLEWKMFDWRVRVASEHWPQVPERFAAVEIDDASVASLGREAGWWWPLPRRYFAGLVDGLAEEGVKAVGFDVFFVDPMADVPGVQESAFTSDEAFAASLRGAGNVVLAAWLGPAGEVRTPVERFRSNALALGTTTKVAEPDNVLRRVPLFHLDERGNRVWNQGVVLAARALDLDLSKAVLEPGRVILRNPQGVERVLQVDRENRLLVPWVWRSGDPRLAHKRLEEMLQLRRNQREWPDWRTGLGWRDRLVLVYSTGAGNNVRDIGPTPLAPVDHQGIALLNVANAVLTATSLRSGPSWLEMGIVLVMAFATAGLSWRLRAVWATAGVTVLAIGYLSLNLWLFTAHRLWLPCVWPLAGALLTTHVLMLAYRILMEWTEAPVRSAFGRVVSSNVIDVLLRQTSRGFVGARRSVTIVFADIRGFTGVAEKAHHRALATVADRGLEGEEAEAVVDAEARHTLETVNAYLSVVADVLKAHDGTLDKYIGDCLTAFWGAPVFAPDHAVRAVRAALAARVEVQALNERRRRENEHTEQINRKWVAAGMAPAPLLPILEIGIGIHTGPVLAGFMGARRHIWNYSIFGREVIIASRLERLAGHDAHTSVILSAATYAELQRLDPELSRQCEAAGSARLRGIDEPMDIYGLA